MSDAWPVSDSESQRQAILASYPHDRDSIGEQLNGLARLAAKICDAPIGLVSLVEANRQVFRGRSGTELTETPREWSFCAHAMHLPGVMVIGDARQDARFYDNPLVTGAASIRFYAGQPLVSAEGAPLGSLCVIDDQPREGLSEDQLLGLRTLGSAAMALLERWRLDDVSRAAEQRSRSTIHDLEQRFRVLADAMPQMVWSSLASGVTDYFNKHWCDYTGAPASASLGDAWTQFLHPEDADAASRVWREAVTSGGVYEVEYRLRRADGEYRWMLARGLPMHDGHGAINRWLGTCTDIQEQKALTIQHELLTRELSHRIKNIFAVIGGLIALTLRRQPEFASIGRDLQQRVLALGRAHDFVLPQGDRAHAYQSHSSLKGMLSSLLHAYQDPSGTRVRVVGEDVTIDDRSATPLALFFHELATNAAKYGALATPAGKVEITIVTDEAIELTWTETGGLPVPPTTLPGFGQSLIEMSVTRQLGGTLAYDWRPNGLQVMARIPVHTMAR